MSTAAEFRAEAAKRILIKDGPYGTAIQAERLAEEDYHGDLDLAKDQKGNNDLLNLHGLIFSAQSIGNMILRRNRGAYCNINRNDRKQCKNIKFRHIELSHHCYLLMYLTSP